MVMEGLKQSKRVSWAQTENLCQVRVFLSEDPACRCGFKPEGHLQATSSLLCHTTDSDSDDSPPPGFEVPHPSYKLKKENSTITHIKWLCPPRIMLNQEWLVVAGEESNEVAVQNQRQQGVFEALYPRSFSIPQNPIGSPEVAVPLGDDLQTPLIPLISEVDGVVSEKSDTMSTSNILVVNTVEGSEPFVGPDVGVAVSLAITASAMSRVEGSLIDGDLLVKLLSNPELIVKLASESVASKQTPPTPMTRVTYPSPSKKPPHLLAFEPPIDGVPPVKSTNYFQNLDQRYGEENRFPYFDGKPKIAKRCAYFNSRRGCVHGDSCLYRHDESLCDQRPRGMKRMRMDSGILGRN